MTVCIACMLTTANAGKAIITASDRMITGNGGEIEYEPHQTKIGHVTKRSIILISGAIELHSEAVLNTMLHFKGKEPEIYEIAEAYGSFLRDIRRRYAEQTYLSHWGFTIDTFLERQKDLNQDFVSAISSQFDSYPIPQTEAIVAGCTETGGAHLYHVDGLGRVKCHDDIGFVAIGIGARHAESLFMETGYSNISPYSMALLFTYAAKKKAETAPGVGTLTDMRYIGSEGWSPIIPEWMSKTEELYKTFEEKRKGLVKEAINEFQEFMKEYGKRKKDEPEGGVKEKQDEAIPDGKE